MDPEQDHIGPNVVGVRASITDEDRDNAVLSCTISDSLMTSPCPKPLPSYPFANLSSTTRPHALTISLQEIIQGIGLL